MTKTDLEKLKNLVDDQALELWLRYLELRPDLNTFFEIRNECEHLKALIIKGNIPVEDCTLSFIDQILPPSLRN